MSTWVEKEWRVPRRGEVVMSEDYVIGRVINVHGTIGAKLLDIENIEGVEIFTNVPADTFNLVGAKQSRDFQYARVAKLGLVKGAICTLSNDLNVPLEIIETRWIEWNLKLEIWVRDLRSYEDNIFHAKNEHSLTPFNLNLPPKEVLFSTIDSNLKWRIQVFLEEKESLGWAPTGDQWSFGDRDDALDEIDAWNAKLKIRRIASLINNTWKPKFNKNEIAYTIEMMLKDSQPQARIIAIKSYTGAPAYFPTPCHAALALNYLGIQEWFKYIFASSQDDFSL